MNRKSNIDSCSIDASLRLLSEFLSTDAECIRLDPKRPGEAGRCNLDGKHFCDRFALFLKSKGVKSVTDTLLQLERILILSGIIRNGGVKAMMYRLETGCRSVVNDYLDDISQRLHLHAHEFALAEESLEAEEATSLLEKHDCGHSAASLLLLLRTTETGEEEQVAARQNDINNLLIGISRRLDGDTEAKCPDSVVQAQK
ncbi:MAG: hypothetical protein K2W95_11380 [Candidatus Obscuribacterales bacterium]|nr:hypothetical protein [Candidatus Obscuribacterales bacterium]